MDTRESWIDNVKLFACIFVVLGHFFQSMVKSEILPRTDVYEWFNMTIYYFHVPLFFICSGYLYQKYTKFNGLDDMLQNIKKKFIVLGIPYFFFSSVTYFMKAAFSSSVNSQNKGFLFTIFCEPTAPYWYLYVLFVFFMFIPVLKDNKNMYKYVIITVVMKVAYSLLAEKMNLPNVLAYILSYAFWFVLGMLVCNKKLYKIFKCNNRRGLALSISTFGIFLIASIVVYNQQYTHGLVAFACGLLACFAIMGFFISCKFENKQMRMFAKYTFPIFLMHTIFAATLRSVLLKTGIDSPMIHVCLGLIASFAGPIISTHIINRIKYLDIILYPGRYIK